MEKYWGKAAILLLAIFGIAMSLLVPSWQTPDENTHLQRIGEALGIEELSHELHGDMPMDFTRIQAKPEEKMEKKEWREAFTKAPAYDREKLFPTGLHLSVIKYLPAALGILLGLALHLPTFWILMLGEWFSLAFYLAGCSLALHFLPAKKEMLLIFMSFPMVIHQVASINADAVLLTLCVVYWSYICSLAYGDKTVGWKHAGVVLGLILLITYIKLPYFFMILAICLIPREKICLPVGKWKIDGKCIRRWRIPVLILAAIACAVVIWKFRDAYDYFGVLWAMWEEKRRTWYLYKVTFLANWQYLLVSSVGQFGWLDSALPMWFCVLTYVTAGVMAVVGGKGKVRGLAKGFAFLVFCGLFCLTFASMIHYSFEMMLDMESLPSFAVGLQWIPFIGGLQGRYFLPFVPLLFLALPDLKIEGRWKSYVPLAYEVLAIVCTTVVLVGRYWT